MLHWQAVSQASDFIINEVLAQELKIIERKEPGEGAWKHQGMLIKSSTMDQLGSQRCWVGRRKAHRKGFLESQRIWVTQRASLPQGGHCALADGDMQCHVQEFPWTLPTAPHHYHGHTCWGNSPNEAGTCSFRGEDPPFPPSTSPVECLWTFRKGYRGMKFSVLFCFSLLREEAKYLERIILRVSSDF